MISFIRGEIISADENGLIIDCNGIGYQINATNAATIKYQVGTTASIFTYMQVREDGISLFGFVSEEERRMFLSLISISGIGPKAALTILSGLSLNDLAISILKGDSNTLCSVKGIGKKTAERIILELKEKISASTVALSQASKGKLHIATTSEVSSTNEAASILQTLGLSRSEAVRRIENAVKQGANTTEAILTIALKS